MHYSRQAGFTLIEVMLFLAITGLLFLIAFWGTGQQLRQVRFTDSMRSMHSYIQKQYSQVAVGANPRDVAVTCTVNTGDPLAAPVISPGTPVANDTAGDDLDCVMLGRLIKFSPDGITATSYTLVGWRLTSTQLTGNDLTDLTNSRPTLSPQAIETYPINWGTKFVQPNSYSPAQLTQAFAFLRSPNTGRIITFAFGTDAVSNATVPGSDATLRNALNAANVAKRSGYCFSGANNQTSLIKLGYDQRTDAIDLMFDGVTTSTDCQRSKP